MKAVTWETVPLEDVPTPPPKCSHRAATYTALFQALCVLPVGQTLQVSCEGAKAMSYMKTQLQAMAKREGKGRRLLSSRNQDKTVAWLWFEVTHDLPLVKRKAV